MREFASSFVTQSTVYRLTVYRRQRRTAPVEPCDGPFRGGYDSLIDFSAPDAENVAHQSGRALGGFDIEANEGAEPAMREGLDALRLQTLQSCCGQDCQVATLPVAIQPLAVSWNLNRQTARKSDCSFGRTPFAVDGHTPVAHSKPLLVGDPLLPFWGAEYEPAVGLGGGDAPNR